MTKPKFKVGDLLMWKHTSPIYPGEDKVLIIVTGIHDSGDFYRTFSFRDDDRDLVHESELEPCT